MLLVAPEARAFEPVSPGGWRPATLAVVTQAAAGLASLVALLVLGASRACPADVVLGTDLLLAHPYAVTPLGIRPITLALRMRCAEDVPQGAPVGVVRAVGVVERLLHAGVEIAGDRLEDPEVLARAAHAATPRLAVPGGATGHLVEMVLPEPARSWSGSRSMVPPPGDGSCSST